MTEKETGLRTCSLSTLHLGPIDWQINRGCSVSLSGPSGCGKSVLLRAMADLDPHQGEIMLDGQAAASMPAHQWRKRVGLLPAEPAWWSERVGDHFEPGGMESFPSLGLPVEAMEWTVSRCSTGERQRLALLRLLQNTPDVLLLDEATAALDAQSVTQVEALIEQYQQQHSAIVIWVSHDVQQRQRMATQHYEIAANRLEEVEV